MIFHCSLSKGNVFQVVPCFSENNIFLYHISLVFSASPAKVEYQIEPSRLKKTYVFPKPARIVKSRPRMRLYVQSVFEITL